MMQTAIEGNFPSLASLPRVEFARLPTPVARLPRLSRHLDGSELWVKRDDHSGTLYGGNKVRKLEFLLGDALEQGHDEVWTVGAIGSHHVLATCIYGRQQGLDPGALHFPQPVTDHVLDNLRALSTTEPDLTLVTHRLQIPVEVLRTKVREWLARHPEVYYIPAGGSSPVGVLGYVNAAVELADQIEAGEVPEPAAIFVAAGTCGTLAGLALGLKLAGLETRLYGVRVVDRLIANKPRVVALARRAASLLDKHGDLECPTVTAEDFELIHDYFGPDYGVPTDEGEEAIRLADDLEDLHVDPTYTGKALAGLLGEVPDLALDGGPVLYWHTLNSVDLEDRIDRADPQAHLPDDYERFFDTSDPARE